MKFKIQYATGMVEEVSHGAESIEAFVNEKFGSTYDVFVEAGGVVEMVEDAPDEVPELSQDALDAEDEALK